MSIKQQNSLLDWVTIAKGFGIILVVVGHFLPKQMTPDYYIHLKNLIYTFHMPLFFLLAGLLYNHQKYSYNELVYNKIKRLVYPFISVAVFFFIIKFIAGLFFQMKHPMTLAHVFIILTNPRESYMSLLWFVYTLFLIFITYPIIRKYLSNNFIILGIFIVLNLVPFLHNNNLYTSTVLGDFFAYIPFFIGGVILREYTSLKEISINGKPLTIMVYLILFSILYWLMSEFKEVYYAKFILGVIGSFLIFNISYFISTFSKKNILKVTLLYTGISSMTIYLFHNLFLGGVKIGFLQILHIPINFETMAIIAITLGVTIPMILETYIFRKYAIFRKYLLGLN